MTNKYGITPQNKTLHIKNMYMDCEIEKSSNCKENLQVQIEVGRKVQLKQLIYNLDAILLKFSFLNN